MTPASSLAVPATQNTAPVHEFRCLYTHDLRQKKKRWQDGYLKFHTFNRRIMVYDSARNFIGDLHWQDNADLQDGDELTLDKGVMVQVGETLGTLQTDLTPLLEKKHKSQQTETARPPPTNPHLARPGSQLKRKSLNALLSTQRGPSGKAVFPVQSPFEIRQQKENEFPEERSNKRQKTQGSPLAWGVVRTVKPNKAASQPLWAKTSDAQRLASRTPYKKKSATQSNQPRMQVKEVIDLVSDPVPAEHPASSSNVTQISPEKPVSERETTETPLRIQMVATPVAKKPIKLPKGPAHAVQARPPVASPTSSPPVSASNTVSNVEEILQQLPRQRAPPEEPKHLAACDDRTKETVTQPKRKTKPLKITTGKPKKMLLCEDIGGAPARKRPKTGKTRSFEPSSSSSAPAFQTQRCSPKARETGDVMEDATEAVPQQPTKRTEPMRRTTSIARSEDLRKMSVDLGRMDRRLTVDNGVASRDLDVEKDPIAPPARGNDNSDTTVQADEPRESEFEAAAAECTTRPPAKSRADSGATKPTSRTTTTDSAPMENTTKPPTKPSANTDPTGTITKPPAKTKTKANPLTGQNTAAAAAAAMAATAKNLSKGKAPQVDDDPPPVEDEVAEEDEQQEAEEPAPKEPDIGPWSREAFDLFDWRPPQREEGIGVV